MLEGFCLANRQLAEAKFGMGFCEALNIRKIDKKKVRLLPAI